MNCLSTKPEILKNKKKNSHSFIILAHNVSNGGRNRRKKGNHLAPVRNQDISPEEHSEIREQPNRTIDTQEKIEPEMLRFTPSDSLLPLLPLQSLLHTAAKANSLSQIMSCLYANYAPCCSLSIPATLPQGLCTGYALCLQCFFLDIHAVIPSNLLNCYPQRPTLTILFKTAAIPTPLTRSTCPTAHISF